MNLPRHLNVEKVGDIDLRPGIAFHWGLRLMRMEVELELAIELGYFLLMRGRH